MTDPYRKLTTAVVEIGTQLRCLADANATPVAADDDAPTTTPDNGRRITSWFPISPELATQRAETMSMLERYLDGRPPCIPDHGVPVHCPGCAADAPTKREEQPRPAEQCRAEHGDDPVRRCIRPARHTEDHAAGDGWHCLEDIAVYPATEELEGCRCHHGDELCSGCRRCPDVCNGCDGPGYGDAR